MTWAQTWVGNNATSSPSWGALNNWNTGPAPTFGNTTDLLFNTSVVPITQTWLGANRTIRSLSFGTEVDSAMGVNFQTFNGGTAANLIFDTDVVGGNATVSVAPGATGNITLGNSTSSSGAVGNPILADNLLVDHQGSGLLLFNRPFQAAAFGITKTGPGSLQTNNNNLLTGALNLNEGRFIANTFGTGGLDLGNFSAVNLNGGTLQINANSNNKTYNTAANNFHITAASTLAYFNGSNTTSYNLNISGSAGFFLGANLTAQNISANSSLNNLFSITRNATGAGNIIVESYNNLTSVTDNPALGRVSLAGHNTAWSGNFVVRQGTAGFGGNVTLSSSGSGAVILGETGNAFGAALQLHSFGFTAIDMFVEKDIVVKAGGFRTIRASSDNTYHLNGNIALEGDLAVVNGNFFNTHNVIINGDISGVGGLHIGESGTLVGEGFTRLTGHNTYLGPTTVGTNATLSILSSSENAIGDSSAVSLVDVGAQINFGSNETIGSLASAGAFGGVSIAAGVSLTTGGNNAASVFSGSLTGDGALIKAGTGTMTLNGTIAVGRTAVMAGSLVLGSAAIVTTTTWLIDTAATLDVTDLVGGLTLGAGQRLGGDGILDGDLSLSAGAQFIFAQGTTLTVSGGIDLDDTFSVASLVNVDGSAIDWALIANGTYTLLDNASDFSNITNFGVNNAAIIGEKIIYFEEGSLQLVVIPEPTGMSLLGLAGLLFFVRYRTRKALDSANRPPLQTFFKHFS